MRLSSQRYEQIKHIVVNLFKRTGENSIPVDPFSIASKLDIKLVAYSSLGEEGKSACYKISKSGFKFYLIADDGCSFWCIYYNDEMPWGHIRFTLLHEIGHIVLGHLQQSDIAEAEANFFAKYAIASPALVNLIKPNDYMDIADVFELSEECALNSWNYYQSWLRVPNFKTYETELRKMFIIAETEGGELPMAPILRMKKGA